MTRRWVISGLVQGVGFRYFVCREATELGVVGWVRNRPGGTVEVVATGSAGELDQLDAALRRGPARARVSRVESSEISDEDQQLKSFEVK